MTENISLVQYLRPFDLERGLQYIAVLSRDIWEKEVHLVLPHAHIENVRGIDRYSRIYNLPTLAYLTSQLICHAHGTAEFGLENLNQSIDIINSSFSREAISKAVNSHFNGISMMLMTAFPQQSIGDGSRIINRWGRYQLMYKDIGTSEGTGSMPKFISEFEKFTGG